MALKDIKNFITEINTRGILKSNKYLAEIFFPSEHYLNRRNGQTAGVTERLALRCDSVTLPGFSFSTIESSPRLGYGPMVRMPYNINYDEMTLTFIVDSNSEVHKTFYDWSNSIVNYQGGGTRRAKDETLLSNGLQHKPYEVGYHDNYKVDIFISVYQTGSKANTTTKKAMKIHVFDAVPLQFPPIPMNWEDHQPIKLTIPFTYTDFSVEYYPNAKE